MKLFVYILALVLILASVSAVDFSMHEITLLSASEISNDTFVGGTAQMLLQVKPGSGAIFIESYPLSQLDTQLSTRVANEIACEFTGVDCSQYDFFYTISAEAPIIGGPSAGGAIAVLTVAALDDLTLREDIAMTGAIGSGGIILPVSKIMEKSQAAVVEGKTTVLIPRLSLNNRTNLSLVDLPIDQVDIYPITNLDEALSIATTDYEIPKRKIVVAPQYYTTTMEETSAILCQRTEDLLGEVSVDRHNSTLYNSVLDYYNRSLEANAQQNFYSSASFCFSGNIRARQLVLEDLDHDVRLENYYRLIQAHNQLEEQVQNYELKTFSDLETYGIVKERLLESKDLLDDINVTNVSNIDLGYAIERYHSAVAWSEFFGLPGKELVIDQVSLRRACLEEVQSVELRKNYLKTVLPTSFLTSVDDEISQAYVYASNEDYGLCLFKASKAKAQADLLLSSTSLVEENYEDVILLKKEIVDHRIAVQEEQGLFPILGYSYSEYALQLVDTEPVSGLLFMEYAISLGDLTKYFPPKQRISIPVSLSELLFFVIGLLLGLFVAFSIEYNKHSKKKKSSRKKPKK